MAKFVQTWNLTPFPFTIMQKRDNWDRNLNRFSKTRVSALNYYKFVTQIMCCRSILLKSQILQKLQKLQKTSFKKLKSLIGLSQRWTCLAHYLTLSDFLWHYKVLEAASKRCSTKSMATKSVETVEKYLSSAFNKSAGRMRR